MVAVKNYLLVFFLLLYFGDIWNIFDKKSQAIKFIKENNIDLASDEDPRIICKTNERYTQLGLGPFIYEERKEILRAIYLDPAIKEGVVCINNSR